mmetsp:Transcript_25240/g.37175  ORF Transcript_25240/g.37175 Transcript_25240/m.37175 type:complete len:890 (+) Transcript_25240:452-3121(+)
MGRIEASLFDPLALEHAGHALFDLYPERRGNIFGDEVYRLTKAVDATTTYSPVSSDIDDEDDLPSNHKFSSNDVVLLTLQPLGSGDFFGVSSLPNHPDAVSVEARVLNTGPYYVDIALPGGAFEAAFGPAPNNVGPSGKGDPRIRLRADRFLSNIPYVRMVAALGHLTSLPDKKEKSAKNVKQVRPPSSQNSGASGKNTAATKKSGSGYANKKIQMDPLLREAILSTYGFSDPSNPRFEDSSESGLKDLARRLAKPPLPQSTMMANQVLSFLQSKNKDKNFRNFNAPQLTSIGAALTRRLTLIQGPPGTGKTTVAGAIAFGFVHQCRSLSPNAKVLASAFSNVGADNLAEQMINLGLKVVRVGKASSVSEHLWDYTLDAAIDKDPQAQKALEDAAKATSNLRQSNDEGRGKNKHTKESTASQRAKRDVATIAVKASIQACRVASTRALREADVIVTTSIGAADPRLLAACGIINDEDKDSKDDVRLKSDGKTMGNGSKLSKMEQKTSKQGDRRLNAPDGRPVLTLPFTIIDEACQSVEPASLIPITASDSCRSLVLLGDPCQLPPTVKTDSSGTGSSPLSLSLMTRLASILPQPVIVTAQADKTERDDKYLNSKPTRQASSLIQYKSKNGKDKVSYRKKFSGSLLLSVQYRMHPSISAFASAVFYDGLLSTPAFLANHRLFPEALNTFLPANDASLCVRFVNVGGRNNERRGDFSRQQASGSSYLGENTSYSNKAEAVQILELLNELFRKCKSEKCYAPASIGIVTPYAAQVTLIKNTLTNDPEFRSYMKDMSTIIEIKSVDAYQGRERDLIIFSAVRSNRAGKVGFLTDWRRMNVALTRAKSGLVVVGDMGTLQQGDIHWEAFGNWCVSAGCVKEVEEVSINNGSVQS